MIFIFRTVFLLLFSFSIAAQAPRIIGFVGQKRVGKDSCADYLVEKYHFQKYAMATPMKDAVKIIFELNYEQLYGNAKEVIDPRWGVTPRELMNFIGVDTLKIRLPQTYPQVGDIYIKHLNMLLQKNTNTKFAISDLRFQNDVDAIKQNGGVVIKITRPGLKNTDKHISEQGVEKLKNIDYQIVNDGSLQDLQRKIESLLVEIKNKA